jgi:transposase
MLTVVDYEKIRRAYYIENKSMRQIERELNHSRHTIKKALKQAEPPGYVQRKPRKSPVLGPYKSQIAELLLQNEQLPRKQRYTGHLIFKELQKEGYQGSESTVRHYIWRQRKAKRRPQVFLPLEYEPGMDAQVDWGEAEVILAGQRVTIQLFVMRLSYSRKIFVMAFPSQRQEAFFAGHVAAFHHFGGVPHRISYDNLKAAVKRVLQGRRREEQERFVLFRSHYLFDSHYCTPGQGHEKGGVEHGVGYARRNFMVPLPQASDFAQLNEQLRQACLTDDQRVVDRQSQSIAQRWQEEQTYLRPLPQHDYDCCRQRRVKLNPYSQVVVETNRYSVPTDQAEAELWVKLYPFRIEIYGQNSQRPLAIHPRCYDRKQDILDPLHYLPLLAQRPGAFHHAKPLRQWRRRWPPAYEQLLAQLQHQWPDGRGVREFIQILQLHHHYPAGQVQTAVEQALEYGCLHLDGVKLCLTQQQLSIPQFTPLDLTDQPHLRQVGHQQIQLGFYNQLLGGSQ